MPSHYLNQFGPIPWHIYGVLGADEFTHSGPLTPYDKRELGQHWFRYWLAAGIHFLVMFTWILETSIPMCFKFPHLKSQPHRLGDSELTCNCNYTPHTTKLLGGILVSLRPSVRLSVCPSVPPASHVRSVASTVLDGFFPYLVQMINSMRGCVACDDLWPWPISSRSFGLDWENRVRSVASTVLDGFFLYLAQMITIIRGCVACYYFFRIWKCQFLANFWNFSALTLKKKSTVLDGFFP